ncbi:MAG: Malto-oligosyltrehalose trehalohydrolase [Chlamydiae bacterium]|nr:Malto-oligosyltrehalose trehalohydrolase [Chlamydiota bacterium]
MAILSDIETKRELSLGAKVGEKTTSFRVWAPHHLSLSLHLLGKGMFRMERDKEGYFSFNLERVSPGDRYFYTFGNGLERPDPVSRFLPDGVHGPTEIVDPKSFSWDDLSWKGIPLQEQIFYEIHVGAYTKEGTFYSLIDKLPYIKKLGVTCLEIMPISQFPGRWNWGYDGASPYAPYSGYGGPQGLKELVKAAHAHSLGICLDVVYNHLGPEGNYLAEFGNYFSDTYRTPWGKALNYDGPYSDHVRHYIIQNALYWLSEYHIDALRLDAIHGIYDFSASPMLPELIKEVRLLGQEQGRNIHVIAESGFNDARILHPEEKGGWDLCGVWNDDFHHAMHVTLTGEKTTYYSDFSGLPDLARSLSGGFVYEGQYSSFRKRRHGNSCKGIPYEKFLIFSQNHDQAGNRPWGERLASLVEKEPAKLAACFTLLTPATPLLFMGEEYGEKASFEYFVDYKDERLMRSIFEGRKRESHRTDMPFPGKESFDNSQLSWEFDHDLLTLYQKLISLRKQFPPAPHLTTGDLHVSYSEEESWIAWEYPTKNGSWLGVFCYLGEEAQAFSLPFRNLTSPKLLFSTSPSSQKGIFPPHSASIYTS